MGDIQVRSVLITHFRVEPWHPFSSLIYILAILADSEVNLTFEEPLIFTCNEVRSVKGRRRLSQDPKIFRSPMLRLWVENR
jgi:hypothetical protein